MGKNSPNYTLEYYIRKIIKTYAKNHEPEGKVLNLIYDAIPHYRAPQMWAYWKQQEAKYNE